jgi:hypothetical protein
VRRFFRGINGRPQDSTPFCLDQIARLKKLIDLKSQSGPGPFTFPSSMNRQGPARDQAFPHDLRLMRDFGRKDPLVELNQGREILGPNDVFKFFDPHSNSLSEISSAAKPSRMRNRPIRDREFRHQGAPQSSRILDERHHFKWQRRAEIHRSELPEKNF